MNRSRAGFVHSIFTVFIILGLASCFRESKSNLPSAPKKIATEIPTGELSKAAAARGLSTQDILAAAKTYVPSGGRDSYIGVMTAGSSGRLAVIGLPSMRVIKYIGVFTAEPWQGFAYDDESKGILQSSAREDISYSFGYSGRPAFSRVKSEPDGKAIFVGDGANARLAVVDLDDYETKQVVTNSNFHSAHPSVSVSENSEFVIQTTASPEILGGKWISPADPAFAKNLNAAVTLWRTKLDGNRIRLHSGHEMTFELPPYQLGRSEAGIGVSSAYFFLPVPCAKPFRCTPGDPGFLAVINWKRAAGIDGVMGRRLKVAESAGRQILFQYRMPLGPEAVAISPSGKFAAMTFREGGKIVLLDLEKVEKPGASKMSPDKYGIPTAPIEDIQIGAVDVGGPSVDLAFVRDDLLYATVGERLVKIDTGTGKVLESHPLGYRGGKVLVPGFGSAHPSADYAVVTNTKPHGRYQSVGPVLGMNAELFDLSTPALTVLYDMSVPQATAIDGAIIAADRIDGIVRYKPGTDSRSSLPSPFGTMPGQERIERSGHRVEVFGTLIRSHITPETVEVEEGDVVTFHMTNLEQAEDQTHGFTVDTYNVHGSWEPGKTASVTFVANRSGVFPYYCTEFCSALHLEMEGYLLVRPKGWKGIGDDHDKKNLSEGAAR